MIFLCPLVNFLKLILIFVLDIWDLKVNIYGSSVIMYLSKHDQLHGHVDFYRTALKRFSLRHSGYSEVMILFLHFYICYIFEHGSEQTFWEKKYIRVALLLIIMGGQFWKQKFSSRNRILIVMRLKPLLSDRDFV
jgi:hypothetical protein